MEHSLKLTLRALRQTSRQMSDDDFKALDLDTELAHDDMLIPLGYYTVFDAVTRLERSMFCNLRKAEPVAKLKAKAPYQPISTNFGPRREFAKQQIRYAGLSGTLKIYGLKSSIVEPRLINKEFLSALIPVRGGLPHFVGNLVRAKAISPSDSQFLRDLAGSILLVKLSEWENWMASEKKKKIWPSQLQYSGPSRRGRPRVQNEELANLINELVKSGGWTSNEGISALRRKLTELSSVPIPSEDTLARLLKARWIETGADELRPPIRRPRTRGEGKLPQK